MHACMYTCIHAYNREREREREMHIQVKTSVLHHVTLTNIYTCMNAYIHTITCVAAFVSATAAVDEAH